MILFAFEATMLPLRPTNEPTQQPGFSEVE